MKYLFSPLIAVSLLVFGAAPGLAGSQAFNCADASGQLSYDGQQLTYRNSDNPGKIINVKSRKISDTMIASVEETCVNKAGDKFVAGSKTSLLILEYPQSWDQKLVQGHFLCVNEFDSYPNTDGIDRNQCQKPQNFRHHDRKC